MTTARKYLQMPVNELMVKWIQLPIKQRIEHVQDFADEQLFEMLRAQPKTVQIADAKEILRAVVGELKSRFASEQDEPIRNLYKELARELIIEHNRINSGDAEFSRDNVARTNELAYRAHYWLNNPDDMSNLQRANIAAERANAVVWSKIFLFALGVAVCLAGIAACAAMAVTSGGAALPLFAGLWGIVINGSVGVVFVGYCKSIFSNPAGDAVKNLMSYKISSPSRTPGTVFSCDTSQQPTPPVVSSPDASRVEGEKALALR